MDVHDQKHAREIAREEIASLCGLVLRRVQDEHPSRSIERNAAEDVVHGELARIFGELLRDFGGSDDEPGEDGT